MTKGERRGPNKKTLETWPASFWTRVGPPTATGCTEWLAGCSGKYGSCYEPGLGRDTGAHRVAFFLVHGRWPAPMLDHLCHNPKCVNLAHLREATPKQNSENSRWALATHCVNGHGFTAENTYITARGGRACRACHRAWKKRDRDKDQLASKERELKYRIANRERINKRQRDRRNADPSIPRRLCREYYLANKDKERARHREYERRIRGQKEMQCQSPE